MTRTSRIQEANHLAADDSISEESYSRCLTCRSLTFQGLRPKISRCPSTQQKIYHWTYLSDMACRCSTRAKLLLLSLRAMFCLWTCCIASQSHCCPFESEASRRGELEEQMHIGLMELSLAMESHDIPGDCAEIRRAPRRFRMLGKKKRLPANNYQQATFISLIQIAVEAVHMPDTGSSLIG